MKKNKAQTKTKTQKALYKCPVCKKVNRDRRSNCGHNYENFVPLTYKAKVEHLRRQVHESSPTLNIFFDYNAKKWDFIPVCTGLCSYARYKNRRANLGEVCNFYREGVCTNLHVVYDRLFDVGIDIELKMETLHELEEKM